MRHFSQRSFLSTLALGIALTCAWSGGWAQEPDPSPTSFIKDEKIDQMVDAYIAIEAIEARANAELERAEDQSGARQVIENAHDAIVRAVERTGLKVQEFNRISQLAVLDPTLGVRIKARMKERQPI
jgi:hypothetical protein